MKPTNFNMVVDFHKKFNLIYQGEPRRLPSQLFGFRLSNYLEEIQEYIDTRNRYDLEGQLDAIVDLVYFALGTAYQQGFDFDEAFRRVHEANMRKIVGGTRSNMRGIKGEVGKPDNWEPAELWDLVDESSSSFLQRSDKPIYTGLIAIDGPDCTGKTTLAHRIAEVTGGEVISLTWSDNIEEWMDEYRISYIQIAHILSKEKVVVIERPWLSHPIYGTIFRDSHQDYHHWKAVIQNIAVVEIMALPVDKQAWLTHFAEDAKRRTQLYPNYESMSDVYDEFSLAFKGKKWGVSDKHEFLRYDYLLNDTPGMVDSFIYSSIFRRLNYIDGPSAEPNPIDEEAWTEATPVLEETFGEMKPESKT